MSAISYVFPHAPVPTLAVAGSDALFPVHRIYCVGRNFADHAVEMGYDPDKDPPFFFQKNPDRSEEHTSELQSLMRISYAVFCLKNNTPEQPTLQTSLKRP